MSNQQGDWSRTKCIENEYVYNHLSSPGHRIKSSNINKSFENGVKFIYMGKTSFQNCIHEEVKSRFNLESVCYLSVCLLMCYL